jgi:hypothetical protein
MTTNTETADKSIVADLDYDTKTAKRVAWSEWEFTVVGPFEIEVRNASYNHLSDEHVYRVMIGENGEPVSCTCKGFQHYHSPNDRAGKHMLACATIGGPTLLDAATTFSLESNSAEEQTETETMADKCWADGGHQDQHEGDECECSGLAGEFPCWPCVRDGKRQLPE